MDGRADPRRCFLQSDPPFHQGEVRKANKGKAEARAEARGAAASLATIAQAESAARAHGSEALQKVPKHARMLDKLECMADMP